MLYNKRACVTREKADLIGVILQLICFQEYLERHQGLDFLVREV